MVKGKSIVEVVGVFALISVFGWFSGAAYQQWGLSLEARRWLGGVIFIATTLIVMAVTRRPWRDFGLTLKDWRLSLDIGMTGYVARFVPVGAVFVLALSGITYRTWLGGVALFLAEALGIWLLLTMLTRQETRDSTGQQRRSKARTNFILLGGLLLLPIVLGIVLNRSPLTVASTVFWQLIVSGFGEEIRYRGYYQSRVNQEFGKPYQIMGIRFGPGLIVASILFGLIHVTQTFNPLIGQYDFAWPWGLFTLMGGFFFGLLREKTDDVIACTIAHGGLDAVGESLAIVMGLPL
ncbi:MAG: CPBP family intramembrane glutamic endopeptidase [Anaerolineae bacterium]